MIDNKAIQGAMNILIILNSKKESEEHRTEALD